MRRLSALLLSVTMTFILGACGGPSNSKIPGIDGNDSLSQTEGPTASADVMPPEKAGPVAVQKTAVQSRPAKYVPIGDVPAYNTEIITDEILSNCTLPLTNKAALPYWTGCILENKISVNCAPSEWENYTGGGWYYNEEEIRYLAQQGFNCVRALYSLSFLSNPEDVNEINVSELEQLDELIAWCAKYNMHLILAQTGLPGKWASWGDNWHSDFDAWHTDENVGGNPELFTSEEMQKTYLAYYEMLAKRYQTIPSSILSFELATEQTVPDADTNLQAEVLGPVAQMIWSYSPDRIVIANDVFRHPPKELAELGCCISLHTHIVSFAPSEMTSLPDTDAVWPMQYLPGAVNENSTPLYLSSESGFPADTTLDLHFNYYNRMPCIKADGSVIYDPPHCDPVYQPEILTVAIPVGTKKLEIDFTQEAGFDGLVLREKNENSLILPAHDIYQFLPLGAPMPSLLIHDDFTVEDISETKYPLDVEYFTHNYLQPFLDCAAQNDVSFLMTEIGTDFASRLTPDEYVAYHETWLQALKNENVGWMYNCIHNILAPEEMMFLNKTNTKFTDISIVEDMYGYSVNNTVMEMLKEYQ